MSTFGRGAFDRLMTVLEIDDRVPPIDGADVMAQLSPKEAAVVFNEVPEIFLTKSRSTWLGLLLKADIAAIPVLRPGEVFDEPQAVHNHMVVEVTIQFSDHCSRSHRPRALTSTPGEVARTSAASRVSTPMTY